MKKLIIATALTLATTSAFAGSLNQSYRSADGSQCSTTYGTGTKMDIEMNTNERDQQSIGIKFSWDLGNNDMINARSIRCNTLQMLDEQRASMENEKMAIELEMLKMELEALKKAAAAPKGEASEPAIQFDDNADTW